MHDVNIEQISELGISGYLRSNVPNEADVITLAGISKEGHEKTLASSKLTHYRPDLMRTESIKHAYSGFVLPIPVGTSISSYHALKLRIGSEIVQEIENLPPVFNSQGVDAKRILALSARSFYGISGWDITNGILHIHGVLTPPSGEYESISFKFPDRVSGRAHWPIYAKETSEFYWYMPGCPYFNFRLDLDLVNSDLKDLQYIEVLIEIKGESDEYNSLRNISVPLSLTSFSNYPPAHNVQRVQRLSNPVGSVIAGFSDCHRLMKIAARYKDMSSDLKIADWGCGFGRVARHLPSFAPSSTVVGIELDDINLRWMRENLPEIASVMAKLPAEVPLQGGSIDILYGVSVMTHIRRHEQIEWLRELVRIVNDDGVLLLTVAGANSIAFASRWMSGENLDKWDSNREIVFDNKGGIDADIGGGGYYIQSKQDISVIRKYWSEIVEIVDYIPSAFGYQDVIVARPKRRASVRPPRGGSSKG